MASRSAAPPRARRRHSGNILTDPQIVRSVRQIG
jgi:hypothetical protein